jgi:RNA polymerase sigma-70 factor (ECF subfamily)
MFDSKPRQFESLVLPHLDAAYSLARWLVRDEHTAEDIVQDAFLRAFQYFGSFRGGDAKPWLLGIVRNAVHDWFAQNKKHLHTEALAGDDELAVPTLDHRGMVETPESILTIKLERAQVNTAVARLSIPFREVLVLREIEELAYEDIAQTLGIPKGTVMSRLSRARQQLYVYLRDGDKNGDKRPEHEPR